VPRIQAIKSLFVQNTSQGYKLVGLGLLSLVLMFADSRFDYLSRLRYYTALAVTPLHYVASLPARAFDGMRGTVRSRDELATENEELRDQLMMQQYKLQKLNYLSAENDRLNELLKASSIVEEEVVRVQLIGLSPDPFAKRILINKGSTEGVYVGQPVIDASGLMGQVVEVQLLSSWVLLITDPQHGTPVQVVRNGTRAIAYGTRDNFHQLTLSDIPNTADIKEGDELVTSGLDQRFPPGYPVGVVTSIYHDPGKPFADVLATPTAQIDRSRNLLLVFEKRVPVEPAAAMPADGGAATPELPDTDPAPGPSIVPAADAPRDDTGSNAVPEAD
jgi:rod shape-determining protein MreC